MAYIMIKFGGLLPGGEVWQCGIREDAGALTPSQNALNAHAQDVYTPFNTWWNTTAIQGLMALGCTFQTLALYSYDTGATTAGLVARPTVTPLTATGAQLMPNQCAVVVSLRSIDPSRKGRGRFYIPAVKAGLTNGQLSPSVASAIAAANTSLINSINALTPTGNVLAGSTFNATTVVVDSIIDTQRRRSNKLSPASVASGNVVAGA